MRKSSLATAVPNRAVPWYLSGAGTWRAVELDPEQPEHHSFLAGELVKLGRVKEAREVIMKGMEWVEKDEADKEKAFQAAAAEEDGKDEL